MDIDPERLPNGYLTLGEDHLAQVLHSVGKCRSVESVRVRHSSSLCGFHVEVECGREGCDLCSLCLDSPARVDIDLRYPEWTRGVLWDSKVYRKGGHAVRLEAGEWERR